MWTHSSDIIRAIEDVSARNASTVEITYIVHWHLHNLINFPDDVDAK